MPQPGGGRSAPWEALSSSLTPRSWQGWQVSAVLKPLGQSSSRGPGVSSAPPGGFLKSCPLGDTAGLGCVPPGFACGKSCHFTHLAACSPGALVPRRVQPVLCQGPAVPCQTLTCLGTSLPSFVRFLKGLPLKPALLSDELKALLGMDPTPGSIKYIIATQVRPRTWAW